MHIYCCANGKIFGNKYLEKHHFVDTRHILLVVGGVLCFFGIAKGTKNTSNNQELQTTG
jgi:hypothetical protein